MESRRRQFLSTILYFHGTAGSLVPDSSRYQTTLWSLVWKATDKHSEEWQRAVDTLVKLYHPPLLAYATRLCQGGPQRIEPDDLVQDFFTQKFVISELNLDQREDGKFRNFLRHLPEEVLPESHSKFEYSEARGKDKTRILCRCSSRFARRELSL